MLLPERLHKIRRLANATLAFTLLKVVGGLYLVWMGVQAWRHAGASVRIITSR